MRVLLISHTCQSQSEGQRKAYWLAQASDIELCLLVPDRWHRYGQWREAEPAIDTSFRHEVGRVRWPWVGPAQTYLHWYPRLKHLLRDFRPDVIDLWEEPWSLVSAHTCWLAKRLLPRVKIVSETEQNIDKRLPPPFERLRRYTLSRADYAIGRSHGAVQVLRRKGYIGPAEVVPNAVDTALFRPMDRASARRRWGVDGFVVGYVGRLVAAKGIGDLIEAVSRMPAHRNPQLLLAGVGDDRDRFQQLAHDRGIGQRVRFLGAQPLEALPSLMAAMDVLVLPSRTTPSWKEQFGRVVIEAHACGIPVLGSDSGAIPDVVGAGGRIVRERDPEALSEALCWFAEHPQRARQMGEAGRRDSTARCSWRAVADQMANVYRRILSESASEASAVPRAAPASPGKAAI